MNQGRGIGLLGCNEVQGFFLFRQLTIAKESGVGSGTSNNIDPGCKR